VEEQIQCSETLRAPFIGDASRQVWNNWTRRDDGMQDIHRAFMRSCNVYFWEIALRIWDENKNTSGENLLQDWAYSLGFGAETNVDLPFERPGIVPDRSLFQLWKDESPQRLDPARLELASPWLGGDLLQAAVGQGAVTVTPLQLANAYAAMVNGGRLWQPYIVDRVEDLDGDIVQDIEPTLLREIPIDPTTVLSLRRDMQQVVNGPGGTANTAFADFGANVTRVGGKTGTAEVIKDAEPETPGAQEVDTALFAGVAPIDDPEYVVVVVIERGGSGGAIAAPTARRILQYLLNGADAVTPIDLGEVTD
jgi:penicillin-binding protein 2